MKYGIVGVRVAILLGRDWQDKFILRYSAVRNDPAVFLRRRALGRLTGREGE